MRIGMIGLGWTRITTMVRRPMRQETVGVRVRSALGRAPGGRPEPGERS